MVPKTLVLNWSKTSFSLQAHHISNPISTHLNDKDYLRSLLNSALEDIARRVDNIRQPSVDVMSLLDLGLNDGLGGRDVEFEDGGAGGFEGGEGGETTGCRDDFVVAGEGFEGDGLAEACAGAGDEPDWC